MNDDKVVIWHPFPAPDGSRAYRDPSGSVSRRLHPTWHDFDDDDLQRWRKLADISDMNDKER